jgi:hypothetical protein
MERSSASRVWFLCILPLEKSSPRMPSAGIAGWGRNQFRTSSSPAAARVWTADMSVELFTNYPVRSDCEMFPPAMARGCTTFATNLRSKHYYVGIGRVRTSNGACPFCRPISATHMSRILTGTSPAHRN